MNKKKLLKQMLDNFKQYSGRYILAFFGYFAITAFCWNLILAFIMKNMLNSAISGDVNMLYKTIIFSIIIIVVGTILQPFFIYHAKKYEINIVNDIRESVFSRILKLRYSYFDSNHSGDLISRSIDAVNGLGNFYGGDLINVLYNIFSGLIAIILSLILDWRMGLIIIVIGSLDSYLNYRLSKPISKLSGEELKVYGEQTGTLQDILKNIPIIKTLNNYDEVREKYVNELSELVDINYKKCIVSNKLEMFSILFSHASTIGLLIVGLLLLMIDSSLDIGTVAAIVILQSNTSLLFIGIKGLIYNLRNSLEFAQRVFEIYDYKKEKRTGKIDKKVDEVAVSLKDVSFSYDNKKMILNNINLTIPQGMKIAIVGYSGSGKSTLSKLLLSLYDVSHGEITINGVNINDMNYETLRNQITYVPQNNFLFNMSIKENIKLGNPDASDEEIIRVVRDVNMKDVIEALPDKYDTLVGEGGKNLSGGQRQRIVLARAILRKTNIFLFDEATASLDLHNEAAINKIILEQINASTVITIAHRLSAIAAYELIYFIDRGQIIEFGTHQELLELDGEYKKLWNLQIKKRKTY